MAKGDINYGAINRYIESTTKATAKQRSKEPFDLKMYEKLAKNKIIHFGSLFLCISIILSTVFIKQHSLFDVLTAFVMAAVMYYVVYQADIVTICQAHSHTRQHRFRQI